MRFIYIIILSVLILPYNAGSQFVGMGRDLLKYPNVKDMFSIASDILGYDLLDLCLNGTREELNRTIHSQPAVVVCSLAAVEKLKEEQPKVLLKQLLSSFNVTGHYW